MSQPMHRLSPTTTLVNRCTPIRRPLARQSSRLAESALILCTARAAGTADERASEAFISAVRLYDDCHWEFAFERFATLADQGHTPAAKLALLMLRYGAPLYGTSFIAAPEQIARWAQRVLRATSRATNSPSSITAKA